MCDLTSSHTAVSKVVTTEIRFSLRCSTELKPESVKTRSKLTIKKDLPKRRRKKKEKLNTITYPKEKLASYLKEIEW